MTYLRFHLLFTLPWVALLAIVGPGFYAGPSLAAAGTVILIVMAFTVPWDNFAVAMGIWDFPEDRVWRRIGYLPVEEYAFFVLQSLMVMPLGALALRFFPPAQLAPGPSLEDPVTQTILAGWGGLWLVAGLVFRTLPRRKRHLHYAWHLLFWFVPVVVAQWIMAGPLLLACWPAIVLPTLGVGFWLVWADLVAVREGIWFFDPAQISGPKWRGILPWEEICFFFLTSLLVAQSYLLFLPIPTNP